MAIDKALEDQIKVPKTVYDEEVELMAEQPQEFQEGGDVDIEMTDDGGAEIDVDPMTAAMAGGQEHEANLAEFLEDDILNEISSDLENSYDEYKGSRSDWEDTYTKGLDLLGFKYENRSDPFQGASGATHPVLAEAVTQFQSLAYKELLPADGPVRTKIIGMVDDAREKQADRVKDFMNYQTMVEMKEYEPEFDQMLFNLPLSGSTFKKIYYDAALGRCVSKFVPAEDLVVSYTATSLDDADTIIHTIKMTSNELRRQQLTGFYKDVDVGEGSVHSSDEVRDTKDDIQGTSKSNLDEVHTLLECHCELDIEGFEDMNPQTGEPSGLKLPYIVTIEEDTSTVLSIRRNFAQNDPAKRRKDYFVHFKFLPGLGFYGFGLIHMIGGLSRTATAALRQLLDAGTLSNLPAGFKMRGIRVRDEAQPLQPGEFRDVDAPGGNLRDAFMPLPFKGPDATLLQLMGTVVAAGQRFASIADMQVGDGNQSAAVGTTVALLERGSRVMSAIHKRLYAAMKSEFNLLSKNFITYLPPMYPYDVVGGQNQIFKTDFDEKVDIVPVADPNIFSQTQRISIAQAEMQIAMTNPQMHNIYHAYRHMYEALGVKDIDQLLPPPPQPQAMDPATENIMALNGKKEFMEEKQRMEQLQQQIQPIMQQVQENPQLQQQLQQNPQVQQIFQQETNLKMQMEARKATLIAEFTDDYAEAEKEVLSQVENDPLLKLKDRELDLKAREEQARQEEAEDKLNLERAKMMQAKEIAEDKLEQSDDHAKMRASVSLAKDGIKQMKSTIMTGDN